MSYRNYKFKVFQKKKCLSSFVLIQLKLRRPNIRKFTLESSVWLTLISGLLEVVWMNKSLKSTPFPGYSVFFWFTLSQNEKETDNPGKEVGFTQEPKQNSILIFNLDPGIIFLHCEMWMDCISESNKMSNLFFPSSLSFCHIQLKN